MILLLLKGRGMVSGLFEKKRDAIPPHPAPHQALVLDEAQGRLYLFTFISNFSHCSRQYWVTSDIVFTARAEEVIKNNQ
jgi:hypothetical protein